MEQEEVPALNNSAGSVEPEISREQLIQQAVNLHQSGDLEGAETRYLSLLEAGPCDPIVLHFMGLLRHHQGHPDDAERLIGRALVFAPEYVEALNNLGNVFNDRGSLLEAARCFERALEIQPDFLSVLSNLSVIYRKLGALEESLAHCEEAVKQDPDFYEGHHNLGMTLRLMGRDEEASVALTKAATIRNDFRAYYNMGMALYSAGQMGEAEAAFRKILELEPDNPLGLHMVAAIGNDGPTPDRASDEYIKAVFNGFANSFDATLEALSYRVPQYIGELIAELYGEPEGALSILDLGCGTGLCGSYARPYADRLVGIDLAAGMLREASSTGQYDALFEAEITQYLSTNEEQFDLLISGDTLIYFGDMQKLLNLARDRMAVGGRLIFTLEALLGSDDYVLRPHGRYAHAISYLERMADKAGLEVELRKDLDLRVEKDEPVKGYLISLQRRC